MYIHHRQIFFTLGSCCKRSSRDAVARSCRARGVELFPVGGDGGSAAADDGEEGAAPRAIHCGVADDAMPFASVGRTATAMVKDPFPVASAAVSSGAKREEKTYGYQPEEEEEDKSSGTAAVPVKEEMDD